ncbi:MAG: hypothetical protein QOF58_7939 [Pseudonocardiales bacterium]|nr:hypothetical protein [Pseudonocardiales bacterium]
MYSTCGGMTGFTSRCTNPSRSRVRNVWVSIFSLTGSSSRRSSLNRHASPLESAWSSSTPHRLVTCSMIARSGHIVTCMLTST